MRFLKTIKLQDIDGNEVEIEAWQHDSKGVFAVDASFLDQVDDAIFSPFDGEKILLSEEILDSQVKN